MNATRNEQGRLSVLVIEDDADTADTMACLLRVKGYRVCLAPDGPTALRLAADAAPDVVLIDVGLPKMDGYAVAERLRRQAGGRRPLLVAVTGYGQEEDRLASRQAGIDLHLLKPVDPEELFDLLGRFERVLAPVPG